MQLGRFPKGYPYDDMLDAIGNNVETNISFDEMKSIQKNYTEARHHVEQIQIDKAAQRLMELGIISFLRRSGLISKTV
ncbi:hypothetical protein [Siminovitchia fortis]|uniref:hypothetical protein n=1 Tax=Siminovitchia fortis TaxID=254758 RepID=UPI0016426B62|nr:hypothetical protein [Siminovitchia fortis]